MSNLTVNQHHVWQYHLQAWSNKKDQVWCLQQGKPSPYLSHTRNVASERFFYEFQELSEADEAYLEWVISRSNDEGLRKVNRGWVETLQTTFRLRKTLTDLPLSNETRQNCERELVKIERTLGEDYHGDMETRGKPMLDALRLGDSSFYQENAQKPLTFIQFLSHQYFRTAKIRNGVLAIPLEFSHCPERTWPIESFIYATSMGSGLYARRKEYDIVILNNSSNTHFITGDQPIINLLGLSDDEVEFFYPLTPTRAMIFTASKERFPLIQKDVGSIEVEGYNFQVYQASGTQIYGNNQDYLATFKGMPRGSLTA